jgi:hypothetical protein
VHVQVVHHLPAMFVAVDDQAEAVLGDAFPPGDIARDDEHVAEGAFVLVADIVDRGDGFVGNDQHVHRGLWTDVAEGGDAVVLVQDGRGDLTGNYLLEKSGL